MKKPRHNGRGFLNYAGISLWPIYLLRPCVCEDAIPKIPARLGVRKSTALAADLRESPRERIALCGSVGQKQKFA